VLLANDRPPKDEHRLSRLRHQHRDDTPARSLTAEERPHPTIDAEP
jgi:hypothetical protein